MTADQILDLIFLCGLFSCQICNIVVFETILRNILSVCFASPASSQITSEIQFLGFHFFYVFYQKLVIISSYTFQLNHLSP